MQVARLFASAEQHKGAAPALWMAVGCCLARVVHASICVLLYAEARQSPTWAAVRQASQLLQVTFTTPPPPFLPWSLFFSIGPHHSPSQAL